MQYPVRTPGFRILHSKRLTGGSWYVASLLWQPPWVPGEGAGR